uniref:Uncharacterized protein n=1 Tax=Bicosoecida sp. CB-2014 TaxID=1486930 RepID=A0A7S1CSL4_9STRA
MCVPAARAASSPCGAAPRGAGECCVLRATALSARLLTAPPPPRPRPRLRLAHAAALPRVPVSLSTRRRASCAAAGRAHGAQGGCCCSAWSRGRDEHRVGNSDL